jgi:protein-tyrosine phosphatase
MPFTGNKYIESLRTKREIRIVFVCLGNICRSPMAAAIMSGKIESIAQPKIHIESAGTSSWHVGQGPNPQSKKAWEAQGYRYNHVASQFTQERLKQADLVLAMDQENFRNIMSLSSDQDDARKIFLMRDFEMGADEGSEVPDPYSLPDDAFEHVREMLENAIDGLIRNLTE